MSGIKRREFGIDRRADVHPGRRRRTEESINRGGGERVEIGTRCPGMRLEAHPSRRRRYRLTEALNR